MAGESEINLGLGIDPQGAVTGIEQIKQALNQVVEAAAEARRQGGSASDTGARIRGISQAAAREVTGVVPGNQLVAVQGEIQKFFDDAGAQLRRAGVPLQGAALRFQDDLRAAQNAQRSAARSSSSRGGTRDQLFDFGTGRQYASVEDFVRGETESRLRNAQGSRALSRSPLYIEANTAATANARGLQADKDQGLADSSRYLANNTRAVIEELRRRTAETADLTSSPSYRTAFTQSQTQDKLRQGAEAGSLSGSQDYLAASTLAATQLKAQAAAEAESLRGSQDYLAANALAATQLKAQAAAETRELASTSDYAEASAELARVRQQIAAAEAKELASTGEYAEATVALAAARKQEEALEADLKAGSDEYQGALLAASIALKSQAAREDTILAGSAEYSEALVAATAALKERQAIEAEAAGSQRAVAADVRTQLSKSQSSAQVRSGVLAGTSGGDISLAAENDAVARRVKALTDIAAYEQRDTAVEAQLVLAKQDYERAISEQVAKLRSERGQSSGLGFGQGGTFFQQLRGQFLRRQTGGSGGFGGGGGGGGTNEDLQGFGQYLGDHATRTLSYAIPGLAIGGAFFELRNSIQQAEQAQKALAEVSAEFAGLGQSSQFSGFKSSIQDIASSTGLAVGEVADLGLVMKGVFGDTTQAEVGLQNVANAAVAMSLSLGEAQKDLTAIEQAFQQFQNGAPQGSSIAAISNQALHFQDIFGVPAKDIIAGTADLAPVANQVGLSNQQTQAVIAATAQRSGLSASDIGEGLGRILPGYTQNLSGLTEFFQGQPAGADKGFLKDINSGAANSQASGFFDLLSSFKGFSSTQQNSLVTLLGGNPQSRQVLIQASQAVSAPGFQGAEGSAVPSDRTIEERNKQLETLQGRFEQLRSDAQNFGVALLNGGVGRVFEDLATGAGDLLKVFTDLNHLTDGTAGQLLGVAAAVVAISKAFSAFQSIQEVIAGIKGLGAATATTTVATEAETVAVGAQTVALGTNAAAAGADAVAQRGLAVGTDVGAAFGAAGAAGTAGAAERGVFGTGLLAGAGGAGTAFGGAVTGTFGLGTLGTSLLAVGAGLLSFEGTLKGLDAIFGKPKSVGTSTSLTPQTSSFVNNFASTQGGLLAALGDQFGTSQQQSQIAVDLTKKNNGLNLLRDYNQLHSTPSEQQFVQDYNQNQRTGDPGLQSFQDQRGRAIAQANDARLRAQQSVQQTTALPSYLGVDFQATQSAFSEGGASFGQLTKAAQAAVTQARTAFNQGPTPQNAQALQQALAQEATIFDTLAQQQEQLAVALLQPGNVGSDVQRIGALATQLANTKSPTGQLAVVQNIVQGYQTELQDEANLATSTAQRNAILSQGITLSSQQVSTINASLKKNGLAPLTSNTIKGQQLSPSDILQGYTEQIQAAQALATSQTFSDPVRQAQANLVAAQQTLTSTQKAGYQPNDPQVKQAIAGINNAQVQYYQGLISQAQAVGGLAQAQQFNDPVRQAQAQIQSIGEQMTLYLQGGGQTGDAAYINLQTSLQNERNSLAQGLISRAQALGSLAQAQTFNDPIRGAQTQIQSITQQMSLYLQGGGQTGDAAYIQLQASLKNQQVALAQGIIARVQAYGQLAQAQTFNDPVRGAESQIRSVEAQMQAYLQGGGQTTDAAYINLRASLQSQQNALAQGILGVLQAQSAFVQAFYANDPIVATSKEMGSIIQQEQAYLRAGGQTSDAAYKNLQAQQVGLRNTQNQNVIDLLNAQAAVSEAVSNVQGQPIEVAYKTWQAALRAAATRAQQDKSEGVSTAQDTQYQQLVASALNAQADYYSSIASTTISNVEAYLTLGKETATQAIAQLEAALTQVKGNTQATNQILVEIRQIQNSAGAQLNFDLPTTLLPTSLYQARALEAGVGTTYGGGPVTVNINVNGGSASSINSAVSKLTAAVGGAQRTGTLGPLLNG